MGAHVGPQAWRSTARKMNRTIGVLYLLLPTVSEHRTGLGLKEGASEGCFFSRGKAYSRGGSGGTLFSLWGAVNRPGGFREISSLSTGSRYSHEESIGNGFRTYPRQVRADRSKKRESGHAPPPPGGRPRKTVAGGTPGDALRRGHGRYRTGLLHVCA